MEVQSLSLDHTSSLDNIMHFVNWYSVVLSRWREPYLYIDKDVGIEL